MTKTKDSSIISILNTPSNDAPEPESSTEITKTDQGFMIFFTNSSEDAPTLKTSMELLANIPKLSTPPDDAPKP